MCLIRALDFGFQGIRSLRSSLHLCMSSPCPSRSPTLFPFEMTVVSKAASQHMAALPARGQRRHRATVDPAEFWSEGITRTPVEIGTSPSISPELHQVPARGTSESDFPDRLLICLGAQGK